MSILLATRISSFFAWDVIVASLTVVVLALTEPGLSTGRRVRVIVGTLVVGGFCGLPLWALFCQAVPRARTAATA